MLKVCAVVPRRVVAFNLYLIHPTIASFSVCLWFLSAGSAMRIISDCRVQCGATVIQNCQRQQ